jgi:hypothetical protein
LQFVSGCPEGPVVVTGTVSEPSIDYLDALEAPLLDGDGVVLGQRVEAVWLVIVPNADPCAGAYDTSAMHGYKVTNLEGGNGLWITVNYPFL